MGLVTDDQLYRGLSEVIVGLCLGPFQPHAAVASEQISHDVLGAASNFLLCSLI